MSNRTIINILLISLIFPINELWPFFEKGRIVNWWVSGMDYPLEIQWYMKFMFMNIADVIKGILIFKLSRMYPAMRLASAVYLSFCVFDLWMFFYNFNSSSYSIIYAMAAPAIALVVMAQSVVSKRKKQGKSKKNSDVEMIGVPIK